MNQTYSITMYSEENIKPLNEISKICYEVLCLVSEFSNSFENFYELGNNKNPKIFNFNYANIKESLLEQEQKINKSTMDGFNLSFYTNTHEESSMGVSISFNISSPSPKNVLVIKLPIEFNIFRVENKIKSQNFFKKLVYCFNPEYGAIVNDQNYKFPLRKNGLPTRVHWINYWDKKIISKIGEGIIKSAPIDGFEKMKKGYLISLCDIPIDVNNKQLMEIQHISENYFFGSY